MYIFNTGMEVEERSAAIGALSLIHGEEKTRAQELNEELEAEAESFREVQKAAQEALLLQHR